MDLVLNNLQRLICHKTKPFRVGSANDPANPAHTKQGCYGKTLVRRMNEPQAFPLKMRGRKNNKYERPGGHLK